MKDTVNCIFFRITRKSALFSAILVFSFIFSCTITLIFYAPLFPIPPVLAMDVTLSWDGNTEPIETYRGWPARDQIGRGQDEWVWTEDNPYPPQSSEPAYFWNNKLETGEDLPVYVRDGGEIHIKQNRDYYVSVPRPGYTPYTYPHPLIQEWEENGPPPPPATPSGLRIRN